MSRARPCPHKLTRLLRQIDAALDSGEKLSIAAPKAGVSVRSLYRWHRHHQQLNTPIVMRILELEAENRDLVQLYLQLTQSDQASLSQSD